MRLSDTAVGLDHRLPVLFLDEEQSVPYPPTDWVADGEVAVGLVDSSEESVGGTGRIGPHQDRMDDLVGKVSDIVTGLVLSRQSTGAWSSSSRWWLVSFDPAFPGRSMAAGV